MFKKSATKLKHKQELLKCKSTIQIATFNARTLNSIGQLRELKASAVVHNVDIVCIQEHRYHQREVEREYDTGDGWTFISRSTWKNSVNGIIRSVGIPLGLHTLKSLNSIEKIQPRMRVATFKGNHSTTIICYNRINANSGTGLKPFYNELFSLVCSIPKHRVLIIGGDMNA